MPSNQPDSGPRAFYPILKSVTHTHWPSVQPLGRHMQAAVYNCAAAMWQRTRSELATAMSLTGAGNDIWRTFWAAQQRFFKLLCVSMKVPSVAAAAKEALDEGHCVVIGLQSTGATAHFRYAWPAVLCCLGCGLLTAAYFTIASPLRRGCQQDSIFIYFFTLFK
jgi:hypothetical protein